jgi:hypothetical protein
MTAQGRGKQNLKLADSATVNRNCDTRITAVPVPVHITTHHKNK